MTITTDTQIESIIESTIDCLNELKALHDLVKPESRAELLAELTQIRYLVFDTQYNLDLGKASYKPLRGAFSVRV